MEANQLIAEIARTTGVRLDRSDPLLAAAVVHEALLNEVLVKLDRQVTIQADRITAASTQAVADAKKEAELLLTDAGTWIDDRMKAAAEVAAALICTATQAEINSLRIARRTLSLAAWTASVTVLVVVSGLCGFALATFR